MRTCFAFVAVSLFALACDDPELPATDGGGGSGAAEGGGGVENTGGGGSPPTDPVSIVLPQANDGAMQANPETYPTITLHVDVTEGTATSVVVTLGDAVVDATDDDRDGRWDAVLDIADLAEGPVDLSVAAEPTGPDASAQAELVIESDGVQLTSFAEVGTASTPRVFVHEGVLYLTYTDRSEPSAPAWLQRIDGAYRPVGERTRILGDPDAALYARTALGGDRIGVLYQSIGNPYATHFKVVDLAGETVVPAIDLDPPDSGAFYGGDLVFDGEAFVVTYKIVDAVNQKLMFARIDATTGDLTGPEILTTSGDGDPEGIFLGFSPVSIEPTLSGSVITFVREKYDALLDMLIPVSQYVTVDADGAVVTTGELTTKDFLFHREARLSTLNGDIVTIFSAVDLTDKSKNIPNLFYAKRADENGAFPQTLAKVVFEAVDDRDDPFLLEHPTENAILLWTDHRSYTERGIENGRIELYVAPFTSNLETLEPVVFPHARFVAGLSELNGTLLGTNVALTWVDERHGSGIADPKPEIYLETAWY